MNEHEHADVGLPHLPVSELRSMLDGKLWASLHRCMRDVLIMELRNALLIRCRQVMMLKGCVQAEMLYGSRE